MLALDALFQTVVVLKTRCQQVSDSANHCSLTPESQGKPTRAGITLFEYWIRLVCCQTAALQGCLLVK